MFGLNESAWFSMFVITALKSAAVLTAAWLAATLLRGRSSASRHLVWMAAFAALLALPFLALSLPPLRVAAAFLQPNVIFQTSATVQGGTPDASPAAARGAVVPRQPASRRPDFLFWMMLVWAAGTAAALLQTAAAMLSMARVRRRARICADPELESLRRALGIRRPVDLLESHGGSMPMTYGPLRPAVFLPADAATWNPELRRMVLLHELAHVRRGDVAMHLLARTALNLYWWNPLAWIAWRGFLKEREHATDDLVLAAGARASEYAGHLLTVARTMQASPAIGWAAIAMARPSNLESRLSAILDARINRQRPGRAIALAAAALAVAIVAPLAAVRAQDPAPPARPVDPGLIFRTAAAQKNPAALEAAAVVANRLKQYDVAQKLLEAALSIREQASGERSTDYAAGLIKLGDLERARNQRMNADAYYTRAVDVLGNQPEAAPALLHLGTDALARKDYEKATGHFQQMQIADPSQAGPALMWMALVKQRQGDTPAAESLFRGALAVQNEDSVSASTTMDLYAQMLKEAGRTDEAALMQGRAAQIRKTLKAPMPKALNASGGVYRVGGGVTAPMLASKVEPSYSDEARAAKYQGTVLVYVEIGPDGLAHNASVMQGLGLGLDEKAIEAINQWQFKPGTKDGVPVTVAATIEVNFRLM
jgi:TonB family protein